MANIIFMKDVPIYCFDCHSHECFNLPECRKQLSEFNKTWKEELARVGEIKGASPDINEKLWHLWIALQSPMNLFFLTKCQPSLQHSPP